MKKFLPAAGLVVALASATLFATKMWSWVLHFDPGFAFTHQAVPTGAPLSSGVTILLVDGLRLDGSKTMPALNALRARGASIDAVVGTPSFSRPGRATIAVGAPPAIHGVTTNRQKRAISLDNLIRRVGEAGGTCRVAGSKIWSGLFAADIARCGVYQQGENKEGPGMFVHQVPSIRVTQEKGIAFVLEQPAMLRIADIISTDFAAHEYGGASSEYLAELQRVDALIAALVTRLDFLRETLVVTSDHGHRDMGGHGGEEAEVLAIPIVMAGAGVRPSTSVKALQADLAPTLAALLGLSLPTASSGHVLAEVLVADDAKLAVIKGASALQEQAFAKAISGRIGLEAAAGRPAWPDLMSKLRDDMRGTRRIIAALLMALSVGFLVVALKLAGPDPLGLFAGIAGVALVLVLGVGARIPAMSFSAINYDELLVPFFVSILVLASVTALSGIVPALLVGHFVSKAKPSPIGAAGAVGLIATTILAVPLLVSWAWNLLLDPVLLPGPDAMVAAFAFTLSIISVCLTTLIVIVVLLAIERRGSQPEFQNLA